MIDLHASFSLNLQSTGYEVATAPLLWFNLAVKLHGNYFSSVPLKIPEHQQHQLMNGTSK